MTRQIAGGLAFVVVTAAAALFCSQGANGAGLKMPFNDPGAGKLPMSLSPCYIAAHQHRGEPCTEPKLAAADASIADRVAAYLARAVFDIDMQDAERAQKEVDSALALDSNNAEVRHLAARIAFTLLDVDRAENEITIARGLKPHDALIDTTYANILIARQANREAVGVLNDVIRRHPDYLFARELHATLFTYMGECCARGNYQVALDDYEYLIQHNRTDATLLSKRAAVLLAIGDPKSAIVDLTAAIELAPQQYLMMAARADAYAAAGFDELALHDYDTLLATDHGAPLYVMFDNDRAKLLAKRANVYLQLKRFDDAARDMVTAIGMGGTPAILRAQVLLRRHGFSEVPLDGHDSPALRQALTSCFGLNACFQGIMRAI